MGGEVGVSGGLGVVGSGGGFSVVTDEAVLAGVTPLSLMPNVSLTAWVLIEHASKSGNKSKERRRMGWIIAEIDIERASPFVRQWL